MTVARISRKCGISNGTFYNCKRKFAGMSASEIRRMRQLEDENKKFKHMYADLSPENNVLKELIEKNS
ncbi:MAG: transposase [Phycisphaerae bacterium]|nr:transposase [Phycisphaerae bacterium]